MATKHGLKPLYDCLAMEVQLCNQVGHARPEEGSEHYFAYAVENEMGHGLPHGDLVGPGILLFAKLQNQDTVRLEKALRACHIPVNGVVWVHVFTTVNDILVEGWMIQAVLVTATPCRMGAITDFGRHINAVKSPVSY